MILTASTLMEEPVSGLIRDQQLLVHTLVFDLDTVTRVVEKEKTRFFARLWFLRPAVDDVVTESLQLFYEPFIMAKARYYLNYYQATRYTVKIDDEVEEVLAFGHAMTPVVGKEKGWLSRPRKAITFDAHERMIYANSTHIALTRLGREIDPTSLGFGSPESDPEPALKEVRDYVREFRVSDEEVIDLLRRRTATRPPNIGWVVDEVFEVTEYTIVCTPIYEARCRRLSTGEIKIIPISGVTGKVLSL